MLLLSPSKLNGIGASYLIIIILTSIFPYYYFNFLLELLAVHYGCMFTFSRYEVMISVYSDKLNHKLNVSTSTVDSDFIVNRIIN